MKTVRSTSIRKEMGERKTKTGGTTRVIVIWKVRG